MGKVKELHNISPDLAALARPVTDLVVNPNNPRHGDVGAISQSLARHGQQKVIVVTTEGLILAGNHTYQAAVALGWTHIAAVTTDLAGEDQNSFALADNRLSDLADYDTAGLIDQLRGMADLTGTGFDFDDLDDLIAFDQEVFTPDTDDGLSADRTYAERQEAREAAKLNGMEVRSLVFVLSGPQFEWATAILAGAGPTHTEGLLAILATHSGTETP